MKYGRIKTMNINVRDVMRMREASCDLVYTHIIWGRLNYKKAQELGKL